MSASQPASLEKFERFNNLPYELRYAIWHICLDIHPPQIFDVLEPAPFLEIHGVVGTCFTQIVPPTTQVSSEARAAAVSYYGSSRGGWIHHRGDVTALSRGRWFRPKIDILHFTHVWLGASIADLGSLRSPHWLKNASVLNDYFETYGPADVRNVAFPLYRPLISFDVPITVVQLVRNGMKAMETIYLIEPKSHGRYNTDLYWWPGRPRIWARKLVDVPDEYDEICYYYSKGPPDYLDAKLHNWGDIREQLVSGDPKMVDKGEKIKKTLGFRCVFIEKQ